MESALFTFSKIESTIDFEGRIALVFFTQGCNFRCRYCHNPELIPLRENANMSFDELGTVLDKAAVNWIDGVCITGGEPTLQKSLPETMDFIKRKGMGIKLDTQGSFPEMLGRVVEHCDYIAMDYKMPVEKYSILAGVDVKSGNILKSLELLKSGNVEYEIRTTVVPGIHEQEDIIKICEELSGVKRFVLQTFIPRENLPGKELRTRERTLRNQLDALADICRDYFDEVIVR